MPIWFFFPDFLGSHGVLAAENKYFLNSTIYEKIQECGPFLCDPKWMEHVRHTEWIINFIFLNPEHYLDMCTWGYVCTVGMVIGIAESHLWEQGSGVND